MIVSVILTTAAAAFAHGLRVLAERIARHDVRNKTQGTVVHASQQAVLPVHGGQCGGTVVTVYR